MNSVDLQPDSEQPVAVGSLVVLIGHYYAALLAVENVSKTGQIRLENGTRLNPDFSPRGKDASDAGVYYPATSQRLKEYRFMRRQREASQAFGAIPAPALDEIFMALPEATRRSTLAALVWRLQNEEALAIFERILNSRSKGVDSI